MQTVPLAINLSPVQFTDDSTIDRLIDVIHDHHVDPRLLAFEITESTLMRDVDSAQSVLNRIKELGCSLSLDDFGTGYSSLSYLRRFPVDHLKIDVSFIRDIAHDPDDAALVAAIISMAHGLNLKTIAEGVETEEQDRLLHILRGDFGQGFLHHKPQPARDVEHLLAADTNSPSPVASAGKA